MAATQSEINAYITNIRMAIADYGKAVALKQRIGRTNILRDKIKLMLVSGYLDCISDYFLQDPYSSNNFFTVEEIRDVMQHINNICDTNYILNEL